MRRALMLGLAAAFAAAPWTQLAAQTEDPVAAEFDKFRAVLEQDNPAELWELKGEQLWRTPGGPKRASLENSRISHSTTAATPSAPAIAAARTGRRRYQYCAKRPTATVPRSGSTRCVSLSYSNPTR